MVIMSNFVECLKELADEKQEVPISLAKKIKIHENTVHRYFAGAYLPTLENALKLADFFQCSLEYLFARTDRKDNYRVNPLPRFGERLKYLFDFFNSNEYRLTKATKISRSATYAWLINKSVPSIENLAKIADYYGTTIDFVIGREN